MCGICGKLDFNGHEITEDLLRDMTDSFSYRGPDDEGFIVQPPIGMGQRRLSIIDLSPSGHQPMCNEDESIWLVFNGEIYDFDKLREDLKSRGHNLKSRTDCETIIHLYEEEGIECLKHINGMFAFALWDTRLKQLWIGRDRLGIKPLHYYWDGRVLIFASEIKAILKDPYVKREIDYEALDLYLTLNFIPAPWTIFRNIKKLEPGNYLLTDEKGISIKTYWDIPGDSSLSNTPANDNLKLEEHKQNLFNLMDDAVKRRLISDVPIGAFLSGGIDSSVIVALMARNSNRSVQTFSIGYNDLPSFDETSYARDVADLYSTDHNEFKLGYKDILDVFPTILEGLDEPFADSSAVPSYIVSRETRNHVTVALSGDGGDELFAGYRMYQGEYWARYYSKIPLFIRNGLIAPLINTLPDARDKPGLEKIRRIKKFIKGMSNSFAERFYGWREIFPELTREELLKSPQTKNLYLNLIRNKVIEESDRFNGDMINLMLYLDVKGLLPNDMLTKVDRMSMANSLEVRTPFLDHSVVEYAFSLKSDLKIKGKTGKFILMETFKDLLPPSLHNRPKWGFEMPIGAWLRKDLKFLIHEYLSEKSINSHDIFNYHTVKDLINRHLSGKQDTSWHLWNLIVFQHWFKTYI